MSRTGCCNPHLQFRPCWGVFLGRQPRKLSNLARCYLIDVCREREKKSESAPKSQCSENGERSGNYVVALISRTCTQNVGLVEARSMSGIRPCFRLWSGSLGRSRPHRHHHHTAGFKMEEVGGSWEFRSLAAQTPCMIRGAVCILCICITRSAAQHTTTHYSEPMSAGVNSPVRHQVAIEFSEGWEGI
jgi:hypothetical protein